MCTQTGPKDQIQFFTDQSIHELLNPSSFLQYVFIYHNQFWCVSFSAVFYNKSYWNRNIYNIIFILVQTLMKSIRSNYTTPLYILQLVIVAIGNTIITAAKAAASPVTDQSYQMTVCVCFTRNETALFHRLTFQFKEIFLISTSYQFTDNKVLNT